MPGLSRAEALVLSRAEALVLSRVEALALNSAFQLRLRVYPKIRLIHQGKCGEEDFFVF